MKKYNKNVKIELFNDDCLNALKNIGDETVDLIVTSPPYAESKKNNLWWYKSK